MATFYLPSSGGYQSGEHVVYNIEIKEGAVSGRTRSVTLTVTYWRTNLGYMTYGTGTCYCKVVCNGTTLGTYSQAVTSDQKIFHPTDSTGEAVLFSKTISIPYNTAGQAVLNVTAWSETDNGNINSDANGGTVTLTSIGDATYTLSYKGSTNDDYGFPESQTANIGTTITLSTHKPARTGYTFKSWNTVKAGTGTSYAPGASYTSNTAGQVYLYAQWTVNTYTVAYNANGGTGAPSSQTKTYGVALTLSSTKPTRSGYTFKGWGVSTSSTTVSYASGASYTTNASIVLYAVWEKGYEQPSIANLSVYRCNSAGTAADDGTYFKIACGWSTYKTVTSIAVKWKTSTASSWTSATVTASGTSGNVNSVLGSGAISIDSTYMVTITVSDSGGSTSLTSTLSGKLYPVDFMPGASLGVAFGKPAETAGLFEVDLNAQFNNNVRFKKPIGGRNLLRYTEKMPVRGNKISDSGVSLFCNAHTLTATSDGVKMTFSATGDGLCVPLSYDKCISNNELVTLSFDYRTNINDPGTMYLMQRTSPNVSLNMNTLSALTVSETEWQHYSVTFSHAQANERGCYMLLLFYTAKYDESKWIEIKAKSLKLERGSVPTDWSPAPEDVSTLELGGTNLLSNTKEMNYWLIDGTTATKPITRTIDNEGFGVMQWAACTTAAWSGISTKPAGLLLPISRVRGKTVTLSFEWRSVTWTADDYMYINFTLSENGNRTLYKAVKVYTYPDSDWQKISVTQTLTDDFFSSGSGTVNDNSKLYIKIETNSLNACEVRKIKMEMGETRSDWSMSDLDHLQSTYPIGSIYWSYNHTSPASLFGGTWTRISPYFLYAAGSTATIGETGLISTDTGTNNAHFIKVSAWRRTA
ncbi:InlB B-repeat-containing protein [Fibrobacter sp.]|uniref:InlB B-repeat-containing protein n=1 Tax=Fibrobacter sp. TaxID=35828 RepID=UPI00388F7E10